MDSTDWPPSPELEGRPVDTTLSLNPFREHTLDHFRGAPDIGFRIRGCSRVAASIKTPSPAPANFIDEWEDEEEELDIKNEVSSEDDSKDIVGPFQPPRLQIVRKREHGFNNRNPLVVTIKVMEPNWQTEVLQLGQARVADMVSDDMVSQGLGPGSFTIRILPSGHIRLMFRTARRAQQLRDRRLFRPLSFGKNCYVQRTEIQVPFEVFVSFSRNTETLVDVLSERNGLVCSRSETPPVVLPGSYETSTTWPQAPDLNDRLLDTAILLCRDHTRELCEHIENNQSELPKSGMPASVWRSFSRNMEGLIKALCQQAGIKLDPVASLPTLKMTVGQSQRQPLADPDIMKREPVKSVAASVRVPMLAQSGEASLPRDHKKRKNAMTMEDHHAGQTPLGGPTAKTEDVAAKKQRIRGGPLIGSTNATASTRPARSRRRVVYSESPGAINDTMPTEPTLSGGSVPRLRDGAVVYQLDDEMNADYYEADSSDLETNVMRIVQLSDHTYTDSMEDEVLSPNDIETNCMEFDATGSHALEESSVSEGSDLPEASSADMYHGGKVRPRNDVAAGLAASSPLASSKGSRRLIILVLDFGYRSPRSVLKRRDMLDLIRDSICEQGLDVNLLSCDKISGTQDMTFRIKTGNAEGAEVLRAQWFGNLGYSMEICIVDPQKVPLVVHPPAWWQTSGALEVFKRDYRFLTRVSLYGQSA
ncbi:MAG: hypothetical protein Q9169_006831 [Polycauliona sp. 2 TL-2023]